MRRTGCKGIKSVLLLSHHLPWTIFACFFTFLICFVFTVTKIKNEGHMKFVTFLELARWKREVLGTIACYHLSHLNYNENISQSPV